MALRSPEVFDEPEGSVKGSTAGQIGRRHVVQCGLLRTGGIRG